MKFFAQNVTYLTTLKKGSENTVQNGIIIDLGKNTAVRLRAGTTGFFTNIAVEGFGEAFNLDGNTTDNATGQQLFDGVPVVDG